LDIHSIRDLVLGLSPLLKRSMTIKVEKWVTPKKHALAVPEKDALFLRKENEKKRESARIKGKRRGLTPNRRGSTSVFTTFNDEGKDQNKRRRGGEEDPWK